MNNSSDRSRTRRSTSIDRSRSKSSQFRKRHNSSSSSSSDRSTHSRSNSRTRGDSPGARPVGHYTSSRDPRDVDSRVFIGNLNTSISDPVTAQKIEELFCKHGRVTGVSLHRGFGFVQFTNRTSAKAAVEEFHNSIIGGLRVDCNLVSEGRMGDRHRSRSSLDRDRGSRESSRLRDYDRFDPYDRPYDREGRRSRERSPLRPDPYDDRYRDVPPLRRADRYPDDPLYDRRDPYPRRDEYYRDRRDVERFRDDRDDPYRDPYRRDSYEYRERERERDGYDRTRPSYDYPEPFEPPVQRPIDCEVIVVNRQQREYAETVERALKQVGLVVDITYLGTDMSLAQALDDVSRRGVLYAIIVTSQHAMHRSVTLNILHGTPQEHRNMPLDDALSLIARNFERYMQNLREKTAASNLALTQVELSIPQLLCLLADGKQLTVDELSRVISYLQERHKKLLENQSTESPVVSSTPAPVGATGSAIAAGPSSGQDKTATGQQQQAELQAKILSIFNPSGSSTSTTSLANTVTNTLPSGTSNSFASQVSVAPAQAVSSASTSIPSLMSQSVQPSTSFSQQQGTVTSTANSSGGMSGMNRPAAGVTLNQSSDQGPVTSVGINFDNPSVQKALDNLIQSGPNLLKNLGQVGQLVQGVAGGQSSNRKALLGSPPVGNDASMGFDNMHGGGGIGRGSGPPPQGGIGGPGGVGGMNIGGGGMGGAGRAMGGGDMGMGGIPRGPPGMQRVGYSRGRGGRF